MNTGPIKLLLADDDVDDRFFFKDSLSKIPIETNLTTVTNGVELMNLLLTSKTALPFHYIRKPGEYSKLKDVIFKGLNSLTDRTFKPSKDNFVIQSQ